MKKPAGTTWRVTEKPFLSKVGGAYRDRTDDLFHAMEALSQLS
jgi:hypothetical protein